MIKRTWMIVGVLTQNDIEWLLRSRLDYHPGEQHYLDFIDMGTKVPVKLAGKKDPDTVFTTSDKEETWLKLYFADRAILIEEEVAYKYCDDYNHF